jgi:hypothetical protein
MFTTHFLNPSHDIWPFFIPIIKILGIFVESLDIVTHVTSNK